LELKLPFTYSEIKKPLIHGEKIRPLGQMVTLVNFCKRAGASLRPTFFKILQEFYDNGSL